MNVLVLVNREKDQQYEMTNQIAEYLASKGVQVYLEKRDQSALKKYALISKDNIQKLDFVIVLGGDGTIIHKLHEYKDYNLAVLGINLGRVGVLTEGDKDNYKEVIDKVLDGSYKLEKRVILDGSITRENQIIKEFYAFNEVLLNRGQRLKMLNIQIKVNDRNDTSFYADGIIIATPTGSSAYSLSNNGPLVYPTAKSFVITPMCAQLKTITSLVVSSEDTITVSVKKDPNFILPNPRIEVDGIEAIEIREEDVLTLHQASRTLDIIKVNLNSSLYEPIFKVTNTFR